MRIFGEASSPFDEIVEKVTAETLTTENWALMMDICDDVSSKGPKACKLCLISIKKRLNHRDPHVVLYALSLLDCLWNNCGAAFRREVSSKEFINELGYKATSSTLLVGEKTRELIKKWSENECKKDSSLSLVESLYKELLDDGLTFETKPERKKVVLSNDPNVVSTEEEEADIAKAIALSLNEVKDQGKKQSQPIYPSSSDYVSQNVVSQSPANSSQRQVKALYDFEAAEDNELSFTAGELITVLDDSDQNWWRGSSARSTGLFPASFVTSDLKADTTSKSEVHQNGGTDVGLVELEQQELPNVEIDEEILLKCFQLLQDCDPTGEVPDSPELAYYEQMSLAQASLIDEKLAQIDKQHNMLAQTDIAIRDVLANYDNVVQQVHYQMQGVYTPTNVPPGAPPPTMMSGSNTVPGVSAQTAYPMTSAPHDVYTSPAGVPPGAPPPTMTGGTAPGVSAQTAYSMTDVYTSTGAPPPPTVMNANTATPSVSAQNVYSMSGAPAAPYYQMHGVYTSSSIPPGAPQHTMQNY